MSGCEGAVIVKEKDFVPSRVVAGLEHPVDGQFGKSHAVVEFLRDPLLVFIFSRLVKCQWESIRKFHTAHPSSESVIPYPQFIHKA